jgi:hypothetical protein
MRTTRLLWIIAKQMDMNEFVKRKKINVNAPVAARARLVEEAGRIRRSEGVRL